jgi:hypothetical protein
LRHSYQDIVSARIGGRMLTLVADERDALIAHRPAAGEPTGIRTRNPVVCLMAVEYLRHDWVLQKAKSITGFEEWDRWWRSDADLRTIMLGRVLGSEAAGPPRPRSGIASEAAG